MPIHEDDPRYRTKLWLTSHITAANLKEDDGNTNATFLIAFGKPTYPLTKVFRGLKNVDIIFSIGKPTVTSVIATRYDEVVPVTMFTIDKIGLTGTKLAWHAELEFRTVAEGYPHGSLRKIDRIGDSDQVLGGTVVYATVLMLHYRRTSGLGVA